MKKRCRKCQQVYPATLEYYYNDDNSKDGLVSYCIECSRKQSLQYYRKMREEVGDDYYKSKYGNLVPKHTQVRNGCVWNDEEKQYILDNLHLPLKDVALHLGRSYSATSRQKSLLTNIKGISKSKLRENVIKEQNKDTKKEQIQLFDLCYIATWYKRLSNIEIKNALKETMTIQQIDKVYSDIVEKGKLDEYRDKYWELDE